MNYAEDILYPRNAFNIQVSLSIIYFELIFKKKLLTGSVLPNFYVALEILRIVA